MNRNNYIKWIFGTILISAMIIGGSFVGGTFYPNPWTVEKLVNKVLELI